MNTLLSFRSVLYAMITLFLISSYGCIHLPKIVVLHDPLTAEEHLQLAIAYEKKYEYDFSLKEYQEVLKKKKFFGEVYTNMANIYFIQHHEALSEEFYQKAIHENPFYGLAYNNLSWVYLTQNKKLDKAEQLLLEAIEKDPKQTSIYLDTLGAVYEKEGRWELALETLKKAEKIGFNGQSDAELQFYSHLEKVLTFLGHFEESEQIHQKIGILNKTSDGISLND